MPKQRTSSRPAGIRWSNWNLLLLVPLFMLITPVFNREGPQLFGIPFFYWYQMAFVPIGVICVGAVYLKTKTDPAPTDDQLDGDDSAGDAR